MTWKPYGKLKEDEKARGVDVVFLFQSDEGTFIQAGYVNTCGMATRTKQDQQLFRPITCKLSHYCILPGKPEKEQEPEVTISREEIHRMIKQEVMNSMCSVHAGVMTAINNLKKQGGAA